MAINGGTAHQDIINHREAALAPDILALAVLDAGVGEHCGLVEGDAAFVLLFSYGHLVWVEPVPDGPVDDLVWRVPKDVNNGVGRVENASLVRQIYFYELPSVQRRTSN
jgi:hypothetical protein